MGDEIREINGISVANQTVEQLQKMLVSSRKFLFLSLKWLQAVAFGNAGPSLAAWALALSFPLYLLGLSSSSC